VGSETQREGDHHQGLYQSGLGRVDWRKGRERREEVGERSREGWRENITINVLMIIKWSDNITIIKWYLFRTFTWFILCRHWYWIWHMYRIWNALTRRIVGRLHMIELMPSIGHVPLEVETGRGFDTLAVMDKSTLYLSTIHS
jgi:hypothetical protein